MTIWLPVVGYEGIYEVSDDGRIRSIPRGRELSPSPNVVSGHMRVTLTRDRRPKTRTVHSVVLEAFRGSRPPRHEARHIDDNPANNALSNLKWGTRRQNMLDRVRNGIHNNTRKTHCPQGHEYTPENTAWVNNGRSRSCRTCRIERKRKARRSA